MTKAELDGLRAQASESSALIPLPSKEQLRELLAVCDAAADYLGAIMDTGTVEHEAEEDELVVALVGIGLRG